MSWKRFIQSHMDVAWAMDFFTEEIWTMAGLFTFYTLFLLHLRTRRVHIVGCTANPDTAWVKQQARNFAMLLEDIPERCRYVIHDRDASFAGFDFTLKAQGIKIVKTPPQAPKCIEQHHNKERPHQGIGNRIPLGYDYPPTPAEVSQVGCKSSLGGLLNHYYKKAA